MICQFHLDITPTRMFQARNYNSCRRVQHQWSQIRTQTNAATVAAPATDDSAPAIHKSAEWQQARPFEEMPLEGGFSFIRKLMPGGKYYKQEMPRIMLDLHKQYGGIYRLPSIMGKPGMVVTYDPQDYERVFRNEGVWPRRPGSESLHYHRSVLRRDFFQGVEGIISSQGEKWGSFRSSVNPVMMQPKTIRLYYQKMSQVNKEFIKRIIETRDAQTLEMPDNFEEELNRWTLESVSVVALDKQLGLLGANRDDPMVKKLFSAINVFMTAAGEIEFKPSIWRYVQTPTFKKLIRALDDMQEVCSFYVNEAIARLESESMEKLEHEQSVLEKLLKIDKKVATVMAMDMMMAGVDTTSSTFVSIMLCLAKNPEKQAKLREEIMKILPNKDSEFTESSMKNLPYLRACIKEAMRHYPLVLGNARVLNQDVVLNGYRVPKGTHVGMMAHMLEYDEGYFPRAAEFLPERWLRSSNNSAEVQSKCPATNELKPTNPFVYLPFGFGPRMCIGKRIVEMELELGVARIIRNFHVEFNHPTDKVFRSVLINVPNVPLKFKFSDVEV